MAVTDKVLDHIYSVCGKISVYIFFIVCETLTEAHRSTLYMNKYLVCPEDNLLDYLLEK